jgi:dihydrofolate synthase / folylpolyglutamate synthase
LKSTLANYKETLEYIFQLLPMYSRIGAAAYKKDLSNTIALLDALGNPHEKLKFVHVAGTNGKGTVSHIIAYGLQQQGLKVGLYTSPHYKDFRERIKINGVYVSKKYVTSFISQNKDLIERIRPSFFEITVAMAYTYFAKKNVDIAVIEVGLGGRLDSTNVITPLLSIITNISYDHTDILGDTLQKIALEKAGIIKPGIPIVIGEKQQGVIKVFNDAAKKNKSAIAFATNHVALHEVKRTLTERKISIQIRGKSYALKTNLMAMYNNANIITGFAALDKLSEIMPIDIKRICQNFAKMPEEVKYMGRWQIISKEPIIILDSAHNEAGIKMALAQLKEFGLDKIHFVIGFVKDKSLVEVLKLFSSKSRYYFVKADIPRGLATDDLFNQASIYNLTGKTYPSVKSGFKAALKNCKKNELIYVGGSIFVTSEII